MDSPNETLLTKRIEQLDNKATQLLLFLSFAFVAVVTMKVDHRLAERQQHDLTLAMRWWAAALLPIIAGVVPVKDFAERSRDKDCWYSRIRWAKVFLLWVAIALIVTGVCYFGLGIWPVGVAIVSV